MNSAKLEKVFESFIDSNIKTMLIDGSWGCGKTYYTNQFIEKNDKKDILYLSLFGYNNINDINTDLFYKMNPKKKNIDNCLKIVSNVASSLPFDEAKITSSVSNGLNYVLKLFNREKLDKNKIIIFDDLERMNTDLEMDEFFGYLFHLLLNEVRIIVLCDSKNIEGPDRIKQFNNYREKIFDRIILINETNVDVIKNYFKDYNLSNIDDLCLMFDNNLRHAERTLMLLEQIKKTITDKNIDVKKIYTNEVFAEAAAIVIKIALSNYKDKDLNEQSEVIKTYMFADEFDEIILKKISFELNNLKDKYKNNELSYPVRSLIVPLLRFYLYDSDCSFINIMKFVQNEESAVNEYAILNNRLYYLSNENKKEFYKAYCNRIKIAETLEENDINNFSDIISNYPFKIYKKTIKQFFKKLEGQIETYENFIEIDRLLYNAGISEDLRNNVNFELDKLKKNYMDRVKKELLNNYKNKTYDKIPNIIYFLNNNNDNNTLIQLIEKNDFFFPDLSGDITLDILRYARAIVNVINDLKLEDNFLNSYVKRKIESTNNKSLIIRLEDICKYLFNPKINLKDIFTKQ